MQAKYPGRCGACPDPLRPGDVIVRGPGGRQDTWVHERCGSASLFDDPAAATMISRKPAAALKKARAVRADMVAPDGSREVFTDGACAGNPGPGGWAWALDDGVFASGHEPATTNQRMEIRAALEAVAALDGPIVVVSDSTYVVNCFRDGWWRGWRQRGWVNAAKQPVANRDLWEPLVDAVESRGDVAFRWVKGHSGDRMNDLVDRLAVEARLRAASS